MESTINVQKILPTKAEIEATREYKALIKKIEKMTKTIVTDESL